MEGAKSNKRAAEARREGQSSAKRRNVNVAVDGGKSNGRQAEVRREGQSSAKTQSVNVAVDGGESNAQQAQVRREGQSSTKMQKVTMGLDTLDCPVCSQPLRPPVFQCPKGNLICSPCRDKLPESKRGAPQRSYGVERIIENTFVPCKHGCLTKITYYDIEEHESRCPLGPCFCPVSGCGFVGTTVPLLDHLTTLHKLPKMAFKYFVPFELPAQPCSLVLRGGYGRVFLLEVASLESLGHSVSLVCAGHKDWLGTIRCSVGFSCFEGHCQVSFLEIERSSLSNGLTTQDFCVVPKVSGGQTDVMLRIMIDLLYGDDDVPEVEEDDEDNSYVEGEDEDMTTKWRMAITNLGVREDDNDSDEEDGDDNDEEEDDDMAITGTSRRGVTIASEKVKDDGKDDREDNQNGN